MENFIGEIRIFPYNRIPKDWLPCEGQTLSVPQNQALFSLISNYYGGDGKTTFKLPDLRGRAMMNMGASPSGTNYSLGVSGGSESVQLSATQMPMHNHNLVAMNAAATAVMNSTPPAETIALPVVNGVSGLTVNAFTSGYVDTSLNQSSVAIAGGNAAHENRVPALTFRVCIAKSGIYPPKQ